jgi:hypothetical protein
MNQIIKIIGVMATGYTASYHSGEMYNAHVIIVESVEYGAMIATVFTAEHQCSDADSEKEIFFESVWEVGNVRRFNISAYSPDFSIGEEIDVSEEFEEEMIQIVSDFFENSCKK